MFGSDEGSLLAPVTFKEPGTSPESPSPPVTVATFTSLWFGGQREHPAAGIPEITGGVYHPAAPRVPGSAEHMRAIRHWVRLGGEDRSITWATLEAPLVQFGNIHLPYAPFPATLEGDAPDCTTIYSWLFNNVWDTNFASSQGGEIGFRFAISASDPAAGDGPARRLAAAITTPLLASVGTGLAPGTPPSGSFCVADVASALVISRSAISCCA